jgi:hypothetical protein
MKQYIIGLLLLSLALTFPMSQKTNAQCFASAGNPMGGSANMGVMDKYALRTMVFYRYHHASQYYDGLEKYDGINRLYEKASYNYMGLLTAYGITNRLSAELEAGYYFDKTLTYKVGGLVQQGFGPSNMVMSAKYALVTNPETRFEFTTTAGVSIPFTRSFQRVNGIELPEDAQPSNASAGMVLQTFLIKENSFTAIRLFWINRFEMYGLNPKGERFGNALQSAAFFSRHFIIGNGALKDWTAIVQLRYQHRGQTKHHDTGTITNASGGNQLLIAPQINCSVNQKWNLSLMWEKPIFQHLNGIQLGIDYAVMVSLVRDFKIKKQTIPES